MPEQLELPEFEEDDDDREEDIGVTPQEIADAVVYSSDWTTETILSQMAQGNIDISPRFQRRDAWRPARKSKFIESLFLGLPVPQIVLAERRGERGRYLVLDGRQRLLTLRQFTALPGGDPAPLALRALTVRSDLNGKTYQSIKADAASSDDVACFNNQTIRSVVIRNWKNIDFLHTVFVRLNTGSVVLSPQELRQALFPGPFVDFLDDQSAASHNLHRILAVDGPDPRMRDVEVLLRHLSFALRLEQYGGNLKKFLDDSCELYNRRWDEMSGRLQDEALQLESACECLIDIFGDYAGHRWSGDKYEQRVNRAVLDALLLYMCKDRVRAAAREMAAQFVPAYRDLCNEQDFANAIGKTTKSMEAVSTRLRLFGELVRDVLMISHEPPALLGKRIEFGGV